MNSNRKNKVMWGISLLIIAAVSIISIFFSLLDVELSDMLIRVMGIISIIDLPVFVYSSVKMLKK